MNAAEIARLLLQLTSALVQAAMTAQRAAELLHVSQGRDLTDAEVAEVRNHARDARARLDELIAQMENGAPAAPDT